MTSTGKTVFAVVVILIVLCVGGAFLYMRSTNPSTNGSASASAVPAGAGSAANASLPSGSSTSDASLNQDTAAIDTQMNGMDTDSAAANTSVTQTSAQ